MIVILGWVLVPILPIISCVVLVKLVNTSECWFIHKKKKKESTLEISWSPRLPQAQSLCDNSGQFTIQILLGSLKVPPLWLIGHSHDLFVWSLAQLLNHETVPVRILEPALWRSFSQCGFQEHILAKGRLAHDRRNQYISIPGALKCWDCPQVRLLL